MWSAIRTGLWGLVLGPFLAAIFVIGLILFDPRCRGPGDSGACAMGLVTVPLGVALPSLCLMFGIGLVRELWRRRPTDWSAAIARLRNWGRED